jgi:hypothetical protein
MAVNEGSLDRAARMIIGIQLMALGLSGAVRSTAGIVVVLVGALALTTGVMGRCPLYTWFHWSTVRKPER